MLALLTNQYPKNGKIMFVYSIKGMTAEQKAEFKAAKGENYRENEAGEPLQFSVDRFHGKSCKFIRTTNGKYAFDDSSIQQVASLCKQYGELGVELAKAEIANLQRSLFSTATPVAEAVKEGAPAEGMENL